MASDKSGKAKEASEAKEPVPEQEPVPETEKAPEVEAAPETESAPQMEMGSSEETGQAESSETAASSEETEVETDQPEAASDVTQEAGNTAAADEESETASEMTKPNSRLLADEAVSDDVEADFPDERIQRILDIELPVNISFGSVKRPLSEVLKLGPGAVLELDRAADEPVTLRVNNKVFAKGEVVDVDGYYGVQITEIASPAQRLVSLGEAK